MFGLGGGGAQHQDQHGGSRDRHIAEWKVSSRSYASVRTRKTRALQGFRTEAEPAAFNRKVNFPAPTPSSAPDAHDPGESISRRWDYVMCLQEAVCHLFPKGSSSLTHCSEKNCSVPLNLLGAAQHVPAISLVQARGARRPSPAHHAQTPHSCRPGPVCPSPQAWLPCPCPLPQPSAGLTPDPLTDRSTEAWEQVAIPGSTGPGSSACVSLCRSAMRYSLNASAARKPVHRAALKSHLAAFKQCLPISGPTKPLCGPQNRVAHTPHFSPCGPSPAAATTSQAGFSIDFIFSVSFSCLA